MPELHPLTIGLTVAQVFTLVALVALFCKADCLRTDLKAHQGELRDLRQQIADLHDERRRLQSRLEHHKTAVENNLHQALDAYSESRRAHNRLDNLTITAPEEHGPHA